eukprot:TRINITY_DN36_c0_g1_i4.p1 TRINITY_DN36_c0_g1~~TRINITY_DN36_c0_g1_i4.p1  ORF type:complete len:152 (+),score=59.36 TRINITY_DN36_c0_g1_i4:91-546(+)
MIRRPPRSPLSSSSAASDVYKRQGFLSPAFSSFKALEDECALRQRFWLVYWVVYSCFCTVECFLEPLLYFVPFYYPIKLGFLIWLFYPQTKGAETIYNSVLKDLIKPYVEAIDGGLEHASKSAKDAMNSASAAVAAQASGMVGKEQVKKDD